jgi:lysophospholipase L1-like esterase
MTRQRRSDLALAAVLAAVALAISPIGIERLTDRLLLSSRITAISLTLDLFLLILVAAALLQGRARKIAFHLAAWVFPVVILVGLEVVAVAVHLAERIAPIEDNSSLKNWSRWPAYLLSDGRWNGPPRDGRLYRPWRGDGIVINELGLRTAPPTPKAPGEWRIAVTGGSTVWGFRVLDADTVPAQLQDALRRTDAKVTIYNFGVEGAQIKSELALLQRFRAVYGIDQVVFYTGGNDILSSYLPQSNKARGLGWLTAGSTAFELIKATQRFLAVSGDPSPQLLAHLDKDVLAPTLQNNPLSEGIRAANAYCDREKIRCDFVLQPLIFTRKKPPASEVRMLRNIDRLYPRLGLLGQRMYADVFASGTPGHIHDMADVLDGVTAPFYTDFIHLNEAGNRAVAEHLAPIVEPGLR